MPQLDLSILVQVLKKHIDTLYDIYTESTNNTICDSLLKQIEKISVLIENIERLID